MSRTGLELQYFDKLSKRKAKWIEDILRDPSGQKLLDSGVDKYSDQAHFIYELLQNADDTDATEARFVLKNDRLEFSHNGTRHFGISNPDTEVEDKKKGIIGDINAIVSYGQSGKKESNEGKIGKFGAGFKSVFQYTTEPEIYDRDFCFKIQSQYIPLLIEGKDPRINKNETLFVLPFEKPKKAYEDISSKINSLKLPLLFLNHLETIVCKVAGKETRYTKQIEKTIRYDNSTAQLINMFNDNVSEKLWLFTREIGEQLQCSVGFFINENEYLIPKNYDAFCYFPTKEHTGLKFIVHAPFLLTESRENIKADQIHNQNMIDMLAELTVDSILHLRDLGISKKKQLINDNVYMNLFPLDEDEFTEVGDRDKLSFKPFYTAIQEMVETEEIIPCSNGYDYASAENAYWGRAPRFYETFDDEKLAILTDNLDARWVFEKEHNYNATITSNRDFNSYINQILPSINKLDDPDILNNPNIEELITVKNIPWLHQFYRYIDGNEKARSLCRDKNVFLNTEGKRSALFRKKELILFLPSQINTLPVIHPDLNTNKETHDFLVSLGIKEPDKMDQARDGVLNRYNDYRYNDIKDFNLLYNVYMKMDKIDSAQFIKLIKESDFRISCKNWDGTLSRFAKPSELYFKNSELENYFMVTNRVVFVDEEMIIDKQQILFLEEIGVNHTLRIKEEEISESQAYQIKRGWMKHNKPIWKQNIIDGCEEYIEQIVNNKSVSYSVGLWNQLIEVIKENGSKNLGQLLTGQYSYRTSSTIEYDSDFESTCLIALQKKKWLFDANGKAYVPSDISIDFLDIGYDILSYPAKQLIRSLGIKDAKFSNEEAEQMKMGMLAQNLGLTVADLEEAARKKKEKEEHQKAIEKSKDGGNSADSSTYESGRNNGSRVKLTPSEKPEESFNELEKVHKEIVKEKENIEESDDCYDEDEFIRYTEKTEKKIKKKELQIDTEINQIKREQELTEIIAHSKKYSYRWLECLLKKELILSGDEESERKNLTVRFNLVEKEEGSDKTLLLQYPVGNIPASIEEVSDIPMNFIMDDGQKKLVVAEAFSIHSYMVKVRPKDMSQVNNISLEDVRQVEISFRQPSFLLEELLNRYKELKFKDTKDLQQDLTENIDFVFGPPGTGKTTYLAEKVLISKMRTEENKKIIVLTPTNKAADVVINKVMELMGSDKSYMDWLIRFGTTADEKISDLPVYKDKHVDFNDYDKCVLVTTIHRFWYDFCIGEDEDIELRDVKWDYVVVDEASMIPLVHILYPLYSSIPEKFIIAGDPFQIQPTLSSEEWKDENIYKMVHLEKFTEHPDTTPHTYNVKLLMMQYRSIPDVGEIFSEFSYDGKLLHNRKRNDQKKIDFGNLPFKTINRISFPVDKYESVYVAKRLNYSSSYQIYSALFTFELAKYLSELIEKNNTEKVSIGIISPYRAQADIIEKLSRNLPKAQRSNLNIGTIHSFQGDECDIVICVMNTPPGSLTKKEVFVNNRNIINVAISRARDYLFVVCPNEETVGIENMDNLQKLLGILKKRYGYTSIDSNTIESIMFDNSKYLEENTFSTAHQNVNIYELPEKKYEIRAEDMAVDIQVHKLNEKLPVKEEEPSLPVKEETVKEPITKLEDVVISKEPINEIEEDDSFGSSLYSFHFKLKKDAEKIFSSRSEFTFVDNSNARSFTIKYRNHNYFTLQNRVDEEMAIISIAGEYLNSVNLSQELIYSYDKDNKIFKILVPYTSLRAALKVLSGIKEVITVTDEELCKKLNIR